VVLLKVLSQGTINGVKKLREYLIIDYYDSKHDITAMMRTTGYPVSITAQMIENGRYRDEEYFAQRKLFHPHLFCGTEKRDISLRLVTEAFNYGKNEFLEAKEAH